MRPGDGLLCSHLTGLGLHLITEDVDGNGQDDNRADDFHLSVLLRRPFELLSGNLQTRDGN